MNQRLSNSLPPNCLPPPLADREAEAVWLAECQRATESRGPGWFVAPRCRFSAAFPPDGSVTLTAGDTVEMYTHFAPDQLQTLADRGVILRGSESGARVEAAAVQPDARWIAKRSFTSLRGVELPGSAVTPDILAGGRPALDDLVRRQIVLDRQAAEQPEQIALAAARAQFASAEQELDAAALHLGSHYDAKARTAYLSARDGKDIAAVRLAHAERAAGAGTPARAG